MTHPVTLHELAKDRQNELLEEAAARRAARQARAAQPARPGLVERVADGVGTLLNHIRGGLAEQQASPG